MSSRLCCGGLCHGHSSAWLQLPARSHLGPADRRRPPCLRRACPGHHHNPHNLRRAPAWRTCTPCTMHIYAPNNARGPDQLTAMPNPNTSVGGPVLCFPPFWAGWAAAAVPLTTSRAVSGPVLWAMHKCPQLGPGLPRPASLRPRPAPPSPPLPCMSTLQFVPYVPIRPRREDATAGL